MSNPAETYPLILRDGRWWLPYGPEADAEMLAAVFASDCLVVFLWPEGGSFAFDVTDDGAEVVRLTQTLGPGRVPVQTWATYASGKADLRQAGVSEFLTTYGEGVTNNAVFLLRWLPGVSVADRVLHGGKVWNIVAIAEIGRRKGLELRVVAA